jgi:hypothetical protein
MNSNPHQGPSPAQIEHLVQVISLPPKSIRTAVIGSAHLFNHRAQFA